MNSSERVCCLCLEGCNSTCPDGLFKVNYPSTVCTQIFSTSASIPDDESSSGTINVTITDTETGSTSSTTESGDNEDKFACVLECPNGYYVNTTGWCLICGQLCATCVGEKDNCTSCNGGLNSINSSCDVTTPGMVTDLPLPAIVGGSVGGVAFLVLVVVGIVCCRLVQKRQMKKKNNDCIPEAIEIGIQTPPQPKSETRKSTIEDAGDYENLPNDEKYRYTKDPCQSATERLARRTEQQPEDPALAVLPLAPPPSNSPHQSIIDGIRESEDDQSATGEQHSTYMNISKTEPDYYQNLALDDDSYVNDDVISDLRRQKLKPKPANNDEDVYQNQDVK
ncbi:hypothetical protein SNE40_021453 [Patella caerulea]|uniref:Uncharacterized protein n=1 Tax=Patella caerulea TaxID=87958 RepID=A0AAN8IZ38_PATCE